MNDEPLVKQNILSEYVLYLLVKHVFHSFVAFDFHMVS